MNIWKTSAALCALALAACGGGDGGNSPPPVTGGGGSGGGGGGGGGGTPTPTPPPPPTFNELTGDQTFNTACASSLFSQSGQGFTSFSDFFTFAFGEAGETWTIAGPTRTATLDETFGPADISFENEEVIAYGRDSGVVVNGRNIRNIFGITTPQITGGIADYVRIGSVFIVPEGQTSQAQFQCVFGVPTELDDTLPAATITFGTEIQSVGTAVRTAANSNPVGFNLDASEITFTADPATGEVQFTLTLQGREIIPDPAGGPAQTSDTVTPFGTFTGSATVSETVQGFEGATFDASGAFVGDFTGWFFGPQGAEVGVAIEGRDQLQDASEIAFYLALAGPQN